MVEPEIVRQVRALAVTWLSSRRIAAELGIARRTVQRYVRDGEAAESLHHLACRFSRWSPVGGSKSGVPRGTSLRGLAARSRNVGVRRPGASGFGDGVVVDWSEGKPCTRQGLLSFLVGSRPSQARNGSTSWLQSRQFRARPRTRTPPRHHDSVASLILAANSRPSSRLVQCAPSESIVLTPSTGARAQPLRQRVSARPNRNSSSSRHHASANLCAERPTAAPSSASAPLVLWPSGCVPIGSRWLGRRLATGPDA